MNSSIRKLFKPTAYILILAALVAVGLFKAQPHISAQQGSSVPREFYARIKAGVGTEVSYQVGSGYMGNVRITGVDISTLFSFIQSRANISVNSANTALLNSLETQVIAGQQKLISTDQIATLLTTVLFERATKLQTTQINDVVQTLRGFNSNNLPPKVQMGRQKYLKIRASSAKVMTDQQAVAQVKAYTDPNVQYLMKNEITSYVKQQLDTRLQLWMVASPEQFSNTNSPFSSNFKGLTPAQSFLLAYSFVADDNLTESQSDIQTSMWQLKAAFDKLNPDNPYPAPINVFPYGRNGYFYSSPTHIFFDDSVQTAIIRGISKLSVASN